MNPRRRVRNCVVLPLVLLVAAVAMAPGTSAAEPVPGSQGTDTSLPATESQVVVTGRGPWQDLTITVNQTKNLTNQAVSVAWTGGRPTRSGPGRFAANYLQIMQCWGDDDGTVPENPGPPPSQCVQGAVAGIYGGLTAGLFPTQTFTTDRIVGSRSYPGFDPSTPECADSGRNPEPWSGGPEEAVPCVDPVTGLVWHPFRAVNGAITGVHKDPYFNPDVRGGNYWLNDFFNIVTTNEIAGGRTGPDGSGVELIEMQTGLESSGLGCGQRVEPTAGGEKVTPKCWIVVVPRGEPVDENVGTPFDGQLADQYGVTTSPLTPQAWQHRIAIPVEFNPVDSPCEIGAQERRLVGNELVLRAVSSWQPELCAGGSRPPYSYAQVSDAAARQQLTTPSVGAPGMAVFSRGLPPERTDPDNPVLYAPLTLSGLVIGFNVERFPKSGAPEAAQQLAGVRVARINLTPRLVAKLLTQSYRSQVSIIRQPDYAWLANNPPHMGLDKDFLRFNTEFELLQVLNGRTFGGLQLPAGNSDAARQVWEWILADPEARDWLSGQPDEWGMVVNPVFATDPARNPSGIAFADPIPNSFPKADPYCFQGPPQGSANFLPPPLCGTDWVPYVGSLSAAAQVARTAADRPRINQNPFALAPSEAWTRELPQTLGQRAMLSLTDTPSAALFGLQVARLSQAGDNGPDRTFIAPDAPGLSAAVASMKDLSEQGVLEPSPTTPVAGAYPLATLAYGAIAPLRLSEAERDDYAAFVEYAAGPGQQPGFDLGQLPLGYVPLPWSLRTEALRTAEQIRELEPRPEEPPPVTTTVEPAPTTVAPTTSPPATAPPVQAPVAPAVPATARPSATPTAAPPLTPPLPASGDPVATDPPASSDMTLTTSVSTVPPASSAPPSVPTVIEPQSLGFTPTTSAAVLGRVAVPALLVVAIATALVALEITKRPRRAASSSVPDGPPPDGEAQP